MVYESYIISGVNFRYLKPCKYKCKFHIKTLNGQQYNCGVTDDTKKLNELYSISATFYYIFAMVYMPYGGIILNFLKF